MMAIFIQVYTSYLCLTDKMKSWWVNQGEVHYHFWVNYSCFYIWYHYGGPWHNTSFIRASFFLIVSCFSSLVCRATIATMAMENISNSRKPHPPIWSVLVLHIDPVHMHTQLHTESFQAFNKPLTSQSD